MFARLIAFILLVFGAYILLIFFLPEVADQYGSAQFNAKIRTIKDQSLQFASGSDSAGSLADKVINTGKSFIDETTQTLQHIEGTIDQKTEQAKTVIDSTKQAYDAVDAAKKDIQNFTTFSGTSR